MIEDFKNKKVLVVGFARSGISVANILLNMGADVYVNDIKTSIVDKEEWKALEARGAKGIFGEHKDSLFTSMDLIIVSPGFPSNHSCLSSALQAKIPIIGELEFAYQHLSHIPLIAITGTNGKSTTTSFIGQLLSFAGYKPFVGGNFGIPLSSAIGYDYDVLVVEVSSFQLEWVEEFRPKVSIILNITEDHLDRYDSFEDYARTKSKIFLNQASDDVCILNSNDHFCQIFQTETPAMLSLFGNKESLLSANINNVFSRIVSSEGQLHLLTEKDDVYIPYTGFAPKGSHNVENLMVASLAVHAIGVSYEIIEQCIPLLKGLPHRLEFIDKKSGVSYYNDSKATNVGSVVCSLKGFLEPVIVLLGGRDKGGSYKPLEAVFKGRVRFAIVYGESKDIILKEISSYTDVFSVETLAEAVYLAASKAVIGDSIVLSPACSSYDQFPNYEVRGERFREIVSLLP